eukprot:5821524-Pyramimonas_sp.AAC.1
MPKPKPAAAAVAKPKALPKPPPPPPDVPPRVPAPPAPPAAGAAAKPGERVAFSWGRYQFSRVMLHGVQIGWGCTCGHHNDVDCPTPCKKQLRYQGGPACPVLNDAQCIVQLKRWILAGHAIPRSARARTQH